MAGYTVLHIGLTSDADGAGTLPASGWPEAPAAGEVSVAAAGATTAVTTPTESARAARTADALGVIAPAGAFRGRGENRGIHEGCPPRSDHRDGDGPPERRVSMRPSWPHAGRSARAACRSGNLTGSTRSIPTHERCDLPSYRPKPSHRGGAEGPIADGTQFAWGWRDADVAVGARPPPYAHGRSGARTGSGPDLAGPGALPRVGTEDANVCHELSSSQFRASARRQCLGR